ncbi:chemotaxis protein CheR [bacterium]|nr:chemotaxis protein CheR [bacterium]
MSLPAQDMQFLTDLIKRRTGIALTDDKFYLLDSRLGPVARTQGLEGVQGLVRNLMTLGTAEQLANRNSPILRAVDEAIATHETLFFRDQKPFEEFRTRLIPDIRAKADWRAPLRIWSAACSSGQEPYTLAMMLSDMPDAKDKLRPEIIATDLSQSIVDKAREASFSQFEVQRGLPITYLVKYFTQNENIWLLKDDIKRMVRFDTHNLLGTCAHMGQFDIIYCRNVLIYFDVPTKKAIVDRLAAQLKPGGHIIVGSAESLIGITDTVKSVSGLSATYCKPSA